MAARRKKKPKWKLVTTYDVERYACGLVAGDRVILKKPIVVTYQNGVPTGKIHEAGRIWSVLSGSTEDPGVVWLRQPDGHRHTWDDNESIFEWFERVEDGERTPTEA